MKEYIALARLPRNNFDFAQISDFRACKCFVFNTRKFTFKNSDYSYFQFPIARRNEMMYTVAHEKLHFLRGWIQSVACSAG
jgi:hypothetical protein